MSTPSKITRRGFLAGTGALAAGVGSAALIGSDPAGAGTTALPGRTGRRVAIIGGGMGGLTAAHELALRGFDVTVFERKEIGGKARSIPVPGSGRQGRPPLPGEHGFRFFPGFYHNVPDTMARIPFPGNRNGVFDNLVDAPTTDFSRIDRPDFVLYNQIPAKVPGREANLAQLTRVFTGVATQVAKVPTLEAAFWAKQIVMYLTSCTERRFGQWEHVGWWDFVKAAGKSEEYQRMLAIGVTRNLVAAKAELASTRTVGSMVEAFFTNMLVQDRHKWEGAPDRVLNGPTNDAWIAPWTAELKRLGVRFRMGATATALGLSGGKITTATIRTATGSHTVTADWFIVAVPVERAIPLWSKEILAAEPRLRNMRRLHTAWMNGIQFYLNRPSALYCGHYSLVDSPWALTCLAQQQFWPSHKLASYGDGTVRDIISVDISDWERPGLRNRKPARECTKQEIAREVWHQLKVHVNKPRQRVLTDDMLHSWFLDPAIQHHPTGGGFTTTNDEPLLVNTIGSWELRPPAVTNVPNLFLAADYVQTNMDLATMEAANESARTAVNGLLERAGSNQQPVHVHQLYGHPELGLLRKIDQLRYRSRQPHLLDLPI